MTVENTSLANENKSKTHNAGECKKVKLLFTSISYTNPIYDGYIMKFQESFVLLAIFTNAGCFVLL